MVQGHALFTRQAGSTIPCPVIDFVGGFNGYFASAYNLPAGTTIKDKFGKDFGELLRQGQLILGHCCAQLFVSIHAVSTFRCLLLSVGTYGGNVWRHCLDICRPPPLQTPS